MTLASALGKICKIPHVIFQAQQARLFKFCITLQCHERLFLFTFLAQTIYTLAQKELIKMNIFETLGARGKFCQIPYANFETTSRFFSKFCIPLQFRERLFFCTFLAQRIYTLLKSSPLK